MKRVLLCLIAGFVLAFNGCQRTPDEPPVADRPPADTPMAANPAANAPVELAVVKQDELSKALAAHKGQVVLVDLWAMY